MSAIMDWIDQHWMFLAPPLTISLVVYRYVLHPHKNKNNQGLSSGKEQDEKALLLQDLILFGWLSLPIYSFHQLEEHGYDVYGRRYHFIQYFNDTMASAGVGGTIELTPRLITIINLLDVHLVFGTFAWLAERTGNPMYVGLTYGLMVVNACMAHVMPAILTQTYNPGAAQSLVMMAPISIAVLVKFYRTMQGRSTTTAAVASLVASLVFGSVWGHGVCLLLPLKLVGMGILNDLTFALWSAVGMALFAAAATRLLPSTQKGRQD